jgi:hypothetical protein
MVAAQSAFETVVVVTVMAGFTFIFLSSPAIAVDDNNKNNILIIKHFFITKILLRLIKTKQKNTPTG